jgi:hypothetical protein
MVVLAWFVLIMSYILVICPAISAILLAINNEGEGAYRRHLAIGLGATLLIACLFFALYAIGSVLKWALLTVGAI